MKIKPSVFVKAAEEVSEGETGCCTALVRAQCGSDRVTYEQIDASKYCQLFAELMGQNLYRHTFWWEYPKYLNHHNERVFALLFAAEYVKSRTQQ